MSNIYYEKVTSVHHWNDTLFSFRTTRDPGFRFENGHFVMLGLPVDGRPLLLVYRASALPNASRTAEIFRAEAARTARGDFSSTPSGRQTILPPPA